MIAIAARKSKPLTAADLSNLNSALDKQKSIRILNDKYEVLIDTHFRESKLNNIATKYLTLLSDLNQKENVQEQTIVGAINLLPTLLISEFTNVPVPEFNTIEEIIDVQNALLDTGILKEVFDSFDPEQVKKVTDKMNDVSKNAGQLMGELAIKQSLQGVDESGSTDI